MAQTTAIIETLKILLKSQGLTYRDVATGLGLSEASVKRLFSDENFSLQRLDQVCRLMEMEIADLVKMMEARQQQIHELSDEQERELVADIKLLLVAFLVLNNWKFEDIVAHYKLTDVETIACLAKLDKLKMIDLLPNNRIRLRVSPTFSWRRNGAIQHFFTRHLQKDFLQSRFDNEEDMLSFPSGMLSKASRDQLTRRISQLEQDFHRLNQQDRAKPLVERVGYSLLLAFRPWRPDVFEKLRRPE